MKARARCRNDRANLAAITDSDLGNHRVVDVEASQAAELGRHAEVGCELDVFPDAGENVLLHAPEKPSKARVLAPTLQRPAKRACGSVEQWPRLIVRQLQEAATDPRE